MYRKFMYQTRHFTCQAKLDACYSSTDAGHFTLHTWWSGPRLPLFWMRQDDPTAPEAGAIPLTEGVWIRTRPEKELDWPPGTTSELSIPVSSLDEAARIMTVIGQEISRVEAEREAINQILKDWLPPVGWSAVS